MKINNKGITLVEVLVSISIMTVVTGIVYSIYIGNSKMMSKTEIKNMLQTEGQYVQQTLGYIGMQSEGIENIKAKNIIGTSEFEVTELDMKVFEEYSYTLYRIVIADSTIEEESNKIIKLQRIDENTQSILSENIISKNIIKFNINPIPKTQDASQLKSADAIDVSVGLKKKKGFNDIEYDISTLITFRNK